MDNTNQQEFSNYTILESNPARAIPTAISKKFMASVFTWMFVALGISTLFAILFASNEALQATLYTTTVGQHIDKFGQHVTKHLTLLGGIVAFLPLVFVLTMSFAFNRFSATALTLFFIAYAATTGVSLSFILLVYTSGSVITCFATASVMFGVMALMGYTTDKDLTSFGSMLMMAFAGMFVAIIINMFMRSEMLGYIISLVGVAVFTGLTAYDVQKLKRVGAGIEYQGTSANDTKKLALMGALNLYLDFINLFLMLLRVFGGRRD